MNKIFPSYDQAMNPPDPTNLTDMARARSSFEDKAHCGIFFNNFKQSLQCQKEISDLMKLDSKLRTFSSIPIFFMLVYI